MSERLPDSKFHGANMGSTWGRQDPDGPHVGPMDFAIWTVSIYSGAYKPNPIYTKMRHLYNETDTNPWLQSLNITHRVTHPHTLGKYNAHFVIFMWKISIWSNLTIRYILKSIYRRISTYFGWFYDCETMRCAFNVLLERQNWQEIFTTPTLWRQDLLKWKFIPVCTLKQNTGGPLRGFANTKPNRNMSRFD